jgi:hypothetical protein
VPRPDFYVGSESDVGRLAARAELADILLFRTHQSDSWEKASRAFQGAYHSSDAAMYSHAAIYLGKEQIIHAVTHTKGNSTSGVQIDDLRAPNVAVGSTVCLLRWPGMVPAHGLFENSLVVLERDTERRIFATVVAASDGKIDAAVAQQIKGSPLLGDTDRMMQRQHCYGRGEPDGACARSDIGQHDIGARQDTKRVEVVLADPDRVHAEFIRIDASSVISAMNWFELRVLFS